MTGAQRFKRYHTVRTDLARRFPKAIFAKGRGRKRALAIGIDKEIAARAPDISAADLRIFFQYYTLGIYPAALKTGVRVDLDGNEVPSAPQRMVGADRVSP